MAFNVDLYAHRISGFHTELLSRVGRGMSLWCPPLSGCGLIDLHPTHHQPPKFQGFGVGVGVLSDNSETVP